MKNISILLTKLKNNQTKTFSEIKEYYINKKANKTFFLYFSLYFLFIPFIPFIPFISYYLLSQIAYFAVIVYVVIWFILYFFKEMNDINDYGIIETKNFFKYIDKENKPNTYKQFLRISEGDHKSLTEFSDSFKRNVDLEKLILIEHIFVIDVNNDNELMFAGLQDEMEEWEDKYGFTLFPMISVNNAFLIQFEELTDNIIKYFPKYLEYDTENRSENHMKILHQAERFVASRKSGYSIVPKIYYVVDHYDCYALLAGTKEECKNWIYNTDFPHNYNIIPVTNFDKDFNIKEFLSKIVSQKYFNIADFQNDFTLLDPLDHKIIEIEAQAEILYRRFLNVYL